jgi:hypothetical protein
MNKVMHLSTDLTTFFRVIYLEFLFFNNAFLFYPVRFSSGLSVKEPIGYRSRYDNDNYDYSRRVIGAALDSITHSRFSRYDSHNPSTYHPYH